MYRREQRTNSFLVLFFLLNVVMAQKLKEFSYSLQNPEDNEWRDWSSILKQIDTESYYDFALIVGEVQQEFLFKLLELELEKMVLLNGNFTINNDFDIFFSNFITLAYIPSYFLNSEESTELFIQVLAEKLNLKRYSRLIFVEPTTLPAEESAKKLEFLLRLCEQYKLLNAIVIKNDFSSSRKYFSYEAFPYFEMSINTYNKSSSSKLFPDKMHNVYGAVIRTRPDQVMPRSVVYTDAQGHLKVTGYISHFLRMYGQYINSTIKYPDDLVAGDILYYRDFINWTQMNLVDIPCSITPMVSGNTNKRMSYMFETLSWCLMMPLEEPQTYKDFLEDLLTVYTILGILIMNTIFTCLLMSSTRLISLINKQEYFLHLADIFANPQVILGHLGSSFKLHPQPIASLRIAYITLFVSGLLYTTSFSVTLNAFLTYPTVRQLSSLDDMLQLNRKIMAAKKEYKTLLMLSDPIFQPYLSLFDIIDSYKEFAAIRGSFNKSYSYPVTSSVWHIYNTQQKLFSKPLFYRPNICFLNMDIMAFVLPPNSIHKQKFDTLINRVRDMGFLRHWLLNNFYDLVKIGKMSLTDISVSSDNNSCIQAKDFYYVMSTILKAYCVSSVVIVVENLWFYRNIILKSLCFKRKVMKSEY